jgi:hypothetical protein
MKTSANYLAEPWVFTDREVAGGVNHIVTTPPVPQGSVVLLIGIRICDITTAITMLNLYKITPAGRVLIHSAAALAAGSISLNSVGVWLYAGEWLSIEFTGIAVADVLNIDVGGIEYIRKSEED